VMLISESDVWVLPRVFVKAMITPIDD